MAAAVGNKSVDEACSRPFEFMVHLLFDLNAHTSDSEGLFNSLDHEKFHGMKLIFASLGSTQDVKGIMRARFLDKTITKLKQILKPRQRNQRNPKYLTDDGRSIHR